MSTIVNMGLWLVATAHFLPMNDTQLTRLSHRLDTLCGKIPKSLRFGLIQACIAGIYE